MKSAYFWARPVNYFGVTFQIENPLESSATLGNIAADFRKDVSDREAVDVCIDLRYVGEGVVEVSLELVDKYEWELLRARTQVWAKKYNGPLEIEGYDDDF